MQGQKDEKKQTGRWSRDEHQRFMLGLMQYGKNWKKVEQIVGTRSGSQVRSHAQKFFNKLQKNSSQAKPHKQVHSNNHSSNQHIDDYQEQQNSLNDNTDMLRSHDDENSLQTPLEIISLIKKQSIDNSIEFVRLLGKVNLSSFKKSLQENEQRHSKQIHDQLQHNKNSAFHSPVENQTILTNLPVITEEPSGLPFLNSFKSMNNILSAYEALNQTDPQNHLEDQSFLIGLTKKYKKYFSKGGEFEGLIDFGNPHQVAKAAELQQSIRKKSWTLAEGIEGNQHDLQDIKNQLKENKNSVSQEELLQIEQRNYAQNEKIQKSKIQNKNSTQKQIQINKEKQKV